VSRYIHIILPAFRFEGEHFYSSAHHQQQQWQLLPHSRSRTTLNLLLILSLIFPLNFSGGVFLRNTKIISIRDGEHHQRLMEKVRIAGRSQ
jgi:hypothetical protein